MPVTRVAAALLFVAVTAFAQTPPLQDVTFSWSGKNNQNQTLNGFGHTNPTPEIDRYSTLSINVGSKFTDDAATALGGGTSTSLVTEINEFTKLANALKAYTDALTAAVAAHPTDVNAVFRDSAVRSAAGTFADLQFEFAHIVKPIDPSLYAVVAQSFQSGRGGYAPVAGALQQSIDTLKTKLDADLQKTGALGMTATLIPPESNARALHLPGYDTIAQSATAAVPNYIPVVDDRTRAEANAAQGLVTATLQLQQLPAETQKSIAELQKTLDDTRAKLKSDVLEKNLSELEAQIRASGKADLGPLLQEMTAAQTLVRSLNAANLTLTGSTDSERLINLATSLNTTADALLAALNNLPADLQKLSADIDAAVKKQLITVQSDTVTVIKDAASTFMAQQTFFKSFADNLKSLASQFAANDMAALSAERLAQSTQAISSTAPLSTTLDVSRIAGDVHVFDRIQINAALYRRDASGNLQPVTEGSQSFVVMRYGIYPDSVRGALIFADPRSKVDRDVSYQPAVALGYYWRYGTYGHPGWNSASPSFGFTMTLLDFSDKNNLELGIAAGVSLFRDLIWTGYGRNLQAKAWYYYAGVNALALGKMIVNR